MSQVKERIRLDEGRLLYLTCTFIALLFWIFVKLSKEYSSDYNFDILYQIPENYVLVERPPVDVDVMLEGRGWDLLSFQFSKNNQVKVDLQNTSKSFYSPIEIINLINKQMDYKNIQAVNLFRQKDLNLQLDEKIKKKIPIKPQIFLATQGDDYEIKQILTLNTDSVEITGPQDQIELIDFWDTDSLFVSIGQSNQELMVDLSSPASEENFLFSIDKFIFSLEIEQNVEKSFSVAIESSIPNDSIRFFPSKVRLDCVVPMSLYDSLDANDFIVLADLSNQNAQSGNSVPLTIAKAPLVARSVRINPGITSYFYQKNDTLKVENPQKAPE